MNTEQDNNKPFQANGKESFEVLHHTKCCCISNVQSVQQHQECTTTLFIPSPYMMPYFLIQHLFMDFKGRQTVQSLLTRTLIVLQNFKHFPSISLELLLL